MNTLNLEQLRAAAKSGGIANVIMTGEGSSFFVVVKTRNGDDALLAKARTKEPRRFTSFVQVFNLLHGVGLSVGYFDLERWNPKRKTLSTAPTPVMPISKKRACSEEHAAWVREQVQLAIDDPRPALSEENALQEMRNRRAHLQQHLQVTGAYRP